MKSKILGLLVAGSLAGPISAQGAYILDTGLPIGPPQVVLQSGAFYQYLGVTFTVAAASSITSVEGYVTTNLPGDLRFDVYQGATPTGTLLFSSVVASGVGEDWRGATGLDWDVAAGDYTLTVVALGFAGAMRIDVPTPAGDEWAINPVAFDPFPADTWRPLFFYFDLGWRIGAEPAAVPEPGTLALLGFGLAGIATSRRRNAASVSLSDQQAGPHDRLLVSWRRVGRGAARCSVRLSARQINT